VVDVVIDTTSGSFAPGGLATWHSGSSSLSWPPDGSRELGVGCRMLTPRTNVLVFIVARLTKHGVIVFVRDRIWWCPIASLLGVPSSSHKVG